MASITPVCIQGGNGCRAVNLINQGHPTDSGPSPFWKEENSKPLGSIQVYLGCFQLQSKLPGPGGFAWCCVICWQLTGPIPVQSHVRFTWMPPKHNNKEYFCPELKDCFLLVHSHSYSTHDKEVKISSIFCASL